MKYTLLSDEDRAKYAPELLGRGHILIRDGEKIWVVKHKSGYIDEEKRDLLGYLLGRKFSNVAEVRLLNREEHQEIRILTGKDESSTVNNTFLVRLVGSYIIDELPCKTTDEAVASELVYSTWIRRRDTHVDNRAYVGGLPLFFDHQTAFLGEPELADIVTFFMVPADYGHAGAWRVRQVEDEMITSKIREGNRTIVGAHHYVHDLENFKYKIEDAKSALKNSLQDGWENLIVQAGFTDSKKDSITNFLKSNLETLDNDIEVMRQIIFKV